MNILIFNWRDPKNPKSGGAEIVTLAHAKYWIQNGHTVIWFTSLFPNAKKEEIIEGIKILRVGNSFSVHLFAPIYYLLNRNSFDIVIDEIHGIPFLTPLYVTKPIVAFIHEVAGEIWDYTFRFPFNIIGKIYERIFFLFYKKVIFWTDVKSTAVELGKYGISRKKCVVIPCPFEKKVLSNIIKKNKPYKFIFLSRLVRMKGIEDVIYAFSIIHKKYSDAHLYIVGEGDEKYKKHLKTIINDLKLNKSIIFFGKVSEKKKYSLLKKSHLLLHASVKEGWGLVVIEAASQSTPSIVYNVNGLRETVKNRKTGIILEESTPLEMSKKSIELLESNTVYTQYQLECLELARSLKNNKPMEKSLHLLKRIYDLQ